MLGSLRLLLALAVAASHVDYRIAGLNPGVSAVVGFYLISGYVMAGLLQRAGFAGSGRRTAEEALELLAAPNCPSGRMDVLLMPDGLADAYDAVLAAVQNGAISEDRLDLSVNKILRMKAQFCA